MCERPIDWKKLTPIAGGADSEVYRDYERGTVIKLYHNADLDLIRRYMELTNSAAAFLANNRRLGTIEMDGETWQMAVQVVPIKEVIDYQGCPIGISSYVAGPKLDSFLGQSRFYESDLLDPENVQEKAFLERLQASLPQRPGTYGQLSSYIRPVSRILNEALGVGGILFGSINVKLRADVSEKMLRFVITDIADSIERISFEVQRDFSGSPVPSLSG